MYLAHARDHYRVKRSLVNPIICLFAIGLILTGCAAPTAEPTPIASTLPGLISPTPASPLPMVEDPATPEIEPSPVSTFLPAVACTAPAALTPSSAEGPYFTAGSPERASLLDPGMPGTVMVLSGYVLTSDCQPVANAKLEFWQADANGVYDNQGYTLRGHQFTNADGFYQLTTVVPGQYPGRTEHIHFKVIPPGGSELTSQLYFPGADANDNDSIFRPDLLIEIREEGGTVTGTFNFIVAP